MVQTLKCECDERYEAEINSISLLKEINLFFSEQIEKKIFVEEKVISPYYVWKEKGESTEYYASKWYRCNICGCLWEIKYPDFPAKGFVRKFKDGKYNGTITINNDEAPKKADVIVRSQRNNNVYYMFSDEIFVHGYMDRSIGIPLENDNKRFRDMYYIEDELCITVSINDDCIVVYVLDEDDLLLRKKE